MTPEVDFTNFHDSTIAQFLPCPTPDREPDYVSSGFSVYWDLGSCVVRSSDHWAGQHGCTGQASCIWSIAAPVPAGKWQAGICAYESFHRRRLVPAHHSITPEDRRAAEALQEAGGALSWTAWQAQGLELPVWARKVFPGPAFIPAAARTLFRAQPGLRHAVAAEGGHIRNILNGATSIRVGTRLEMPEDLPSPAPADWQSARIDFLLFRKSAGKCEKPTCERKTHDP